MNIKEKHFMLGSSSMILDSALESNEATVKAKMQSFGSNPPGKNKHSQEL